MTISPTDPINIPSCSVAGDTGIGPSSVPWSHVYLSQSQSSFQQESVFNNQNRAVRSLIQFAKEEFKVLLLENISPTAMKILEKQIFQVETIPTALSEDELIRKLENVTVLGIRSKTKVTKRVLEAAKQLAVVGCFCIGTNQVDLEHAASRGVAVFNSPFSNSRSVAELVIAEIISLARQLGDRNMELHNGTWKKISKGCWEIRGKTLGIVGCGHIGCQVSVLAESMGMRVVYYDILPIMAMGTAKQVPSLQALLEMSDFVSIHVPDTPETRNMMGAKEFGWMKARSYIINNARGAIVDIPAMIDALRSGKLAGAAIDVYPNEPASNGDNFNTSLSDWTADLREMPNVILTPHIGGSTEEAQEAIGIEVSTALVRYVTEAATLGAVNLPEVALSSMTINQADHVRVAFVHRNVPGVLSNVNRILRKHNVAKQCSDSRGDVAYLLADIGNVSPMEIRELHERLQAIPACIRLSILC